MKIDELSWSDNSGWFFQKKRVDDNSLVQIVFIFGTVKALVDGEFLCPLRQLYPNAKIVGGSSAGNIQDNYLSTDEIVASAIYFENSRIEVSTKELSDTKNSFEIGKEVLDELHTKGDDLKHILIFSDGIHINGSMLVRGFTDNVQKRVPISGGLFGEETANFRETYAVPDSEAKKNYVIGVGLYGDNLLIRSGSSAGWEDFGAERIITKSTGNVVYEIDGQPALNLYRKYLGELAKELPASGLRFPLNIWRNDEDIPVIRTLFSINEEENSLTFVGDVPQNYKARLMKTNIDGLIDGAEKAVRMTRYREDSDTKDSQSLCIAVSCIGRRLVLNQLVEEEIDVLKEYLGDNMSIIGFYSFGEIAPFSRELKSCRFHNQTMTITVIEERV